MDWRSRPNRSDAYYWYIEPVWSDPTVVRIQEKPDTNTWVATDIGRHFGEQTVDVMSGHFAGPIPYPSGSPFPGDEPEAPRRDGENEGTTTT